MIEQYLPLIPMDDLYSFKFNGYSNSDHLVYSCTKSLEVYSSDGIMFPDECNIIFTYSNN